MSLRKDYKNDQENFFIFKDKTPVAPYHVRTVLRKLLKTLNLESNYYDTHSLRIGRMSDLVKLGYSIEDVKRLGRWKSNAVYKYIKNV